MRYFAVFMAGCIGFLSLSQEILWVRLVSFALQGRPQSFALVLGVFIFGIALGAEAGKRLSEKKCDLVAASAWVLSMAALVDAVILLARSRWFVVDNTWHSFLVLIIAAAASKSALFPIMHHIGAQHSRRGLGISISMVYFSNIIGSTLGPLVTGFLLLDHLDLHQAFSMIVAADIVLASICFAAARMWTAVAVTAVISVLTAGYAAQKQPILQAKQIVENRQGVLHVMEGGAAGDIVFGGNVYDGRINTSLRINSNMVDRVYILAALQPAPKRILAIGLSGGAWVKILSGFPGVERIDVVEINPGYLKIIRRYAEVAAILQDARIHIYIDDGRRWLKRHPAEKYDLIVMNTTFHWRKFTTNLLSADFLRIVHAHMSRDAIFAFNTTGSMDAFKTADVVFRHNYLYENFVMSGDFNFCSNLSTGFSRIAAMRSGNKPVFNLGDTKDVQAIRRALSVPFRTFSEIQQASSRQYEVITDQNMLTEYKYDF